MSNLDFSQEGINKLLYARTLCDEYYNNVKTNPDLKNVYSQNLNFELAKLGFTDYMTFKFINASYNVYEFDNCYRVRHKDKPLTIEPPEMEINDFCIGGSGCKKRGYPPCANEMNAEFVRCYNNNNILKFMDYKESKICQEHYQAAEKLGLNTDKLYVPHPLGLIGCSNLSPETKTPIFCEGVCIKIKEPLFDLFWGMERYFAMGDFQHNLRISMHGGTQ